MHNHFPPCRDRGPVPYAAARTTDEFARADQKIVDPAVGQAGKAVHDARCAVTMLYQSET